MASSKDLLAHDGPSTPEPPGLRERKAALTRVAIGRALSTRLMTKSLGEITVEELAAEASVSRVTFFNYFPTKEHAFDFVLTTWLYEIEAGMVARGLSGRRGIEYLFDGMAELIATSPVRARQMIGHLAARPLDRPQLEIGRAERSLLVPGAESVVANANGSLGTILMRLVDDARRTGEIDASESAYDMGHLLGALYLGGALIGHSKPNQDWRRLYRHHVRHVLGPAVKPAATKPRVKVAANRGKSR